MYSCEHVASLRSMLDSPMWTLGNISDSPRHFETDLQGMTDDSVI